MLPHHLPRLLMQPVPSVSTPENGNPGTAICNNSWCESSRNAETPHGFGLTRWSPGAVWQQWNLEGILDAGRVSWIAGKRETRETGFVLSSRFGNLWFPNHFHIQVYVFVHWSIEIPTLSILAGHATRELLGVLFSTAVGKTRVYVVWYLEHMTANFPYQ